MKRIYSLIVAGGLLAAGCDSYFNEDLYQNIPQENAYATVSDVENALNGVYYAFGSYRFMGRNAVAIGDMSADMAVADAKSGHFVTLNTYTFSETEGVLEDVWQYGYKVIDLATRSINGTEALLAAGGLGEADVATLNKAMAQCYALRAFSAFQLVNIFGLPYGTDNDEHGGLVIVEEKPIELRAKVSRSSVKATYEWILRDVEKAVKTPNVVGRDVQKYFNGAAVKALEARVNLYMGKYGKAKEAAAEALKLRNAAPVEDEAYVGMWKSTAISGEDIFTIAKSSDDNLSANSLNTLYGSYGGALTKRAVGLFAKGDIRAQLVGDGKNPRRPMKFPGIAGADAVNNIPVFRVSEMYLIMAEAAAQSGDVSGARKELLNTAKRNPAIRTEDDLPGTKEALLAFIAEERQRELFEEGHRWYDARRTGEKIEVADGKYYIISADYAPVGRMQCARADKLEGPYETVVISNRETMGTQRGWWTKGYGFWSNIPNEGEAMEFERPSENGFGAVTLHQGGIVDLPNGEWWGFSMMDVKSAGRLTFLSPVTWKDGWPYFGLEGNLGRSPRTWFKPDTGTDIAPLTTYQRDDDFSSAKLKPIWQWNHIPVDKKWSLTEKKGVLRLHTLPAKNFMYAKNTLTQRAIGPESSATIELNAKSLKKGDVAGLGLLNVPYY